MIKLDGFFRTILKDIDLAMSFKNIMLDAARLARYFIKLIALPISFVSCSIHPILYQTWPKWQLGTSIHAIWHWPWCDLWPWHRWWKYNFWYKMPLLLQTMFNDDTVGSGDLTLLGVYMVFTDKGSKFINPRLTEPFFVTRPTEGMVTLPSRFSIWNPVWCLFWYQCLA